MKNNNHHPDPFGEEDQPKGLLLWGPLSIALHVLLLIAIGTFAATRPDLPREELAREPKLVLNAERAEALSEMAEEMNRDELEMAVDVLEEIQEEMETLREEKLAEYREKEMEMMQSAPTEAVDALTQALDHQLKALENEKEVLQKETTPEIIKAQNKALSEQSEAAVAQEKAAQNLKLAGDDFKEAADKLQESRETQKEADDLQVAASEIAKKISNVERDDDRREGEVNRKKGERDYQQKELDKAKQWLEDETAKVEDKQETQKEKAAVLTDADSIVKATEEAKNQVAAGDKQALKAADQNLKNAKQAAKRAKDDVNKAKKSLGSQQYQQNRAEKKIDEVEKRLAGKQNELDDRQSTLDTAEAKKTDLKKDLESKQSEAIMAQAKAAESMKASKAAAEKAVADGGKAPEDAPTLDTAPALAKMDKKNAKMADLYDRAVAVENAINETYRDARAAELAKIAEIPFDDAKAQTQPLTTDRPDLAQALTGEDVRTGEDLAKQRKAIEEAVKEGLAMMNRADTLLAATRSLSSSAKNMAGSSIDAGMSTSVMKLQDKNALPDNVQDLSSQMSAYYQKGGANSSNPAPAHGSGWTADNRQPPPLPKNFKPMPARVVSADGIATTWFSVQTWYMIGPFDNPARKNADTAFPPESVVDLDATYRGKDGRALQWEFIQSGGTDGKMLMNPPRTRGERESIYYAYTELKFEEDFETWIALGFDDKGTVWINGFPVWESGVGNFNWAPNQKFRRVTFKKGINRVLYRIENGGGWCAFSMYVNLTNESKL